MEKFLAALLSAVQTVNAYLSDYILIFLLVGAGLFFTIATRFVQVRCFGEGLKQVFGNISLKGEKAKSAAPELEAELFATDPLCGLARSFWRF